MAKATKHERAHIFENERPVVIQDRVQAMGGTCLDMRFLNEDFMDVQVQGRGTLKVYGWAAYAMRRQKDGTLCFSSCVITARVSGSRWRQVKQEDLHAQYLWGIESRYDDDRSRILRPQRFDLEGWQAPRNRLGLVRKSETFEFESRFIGKIPPDTRRKILELKDLGADLAILEVNPKWCHREIRHGDPLLVAWIMPGLWYLVDKFNCE